MIAINIVSIVLCGIGWIISGIAAVGGGDLEKVFGRLALLILTAALVALSLDLAVSS